MKPTLRGAALATATVIGSLVALGLALEAGLRIFPGLTPHGVYGFNIYNPDLNSMVLRPPGLFYNKIRYQARMPNRDGFLDVDHIEEKPDGVYRVGIFGDSYVEAVQVPLEQSFFRKIPSRIAGREVETLAFGISGWGTLHSLLAQRAFGTRYNLDMVIYSFCGNDPGDHAYALQGHDSNYSRPLAVLSDGEAGFEIRRVAERDPPSGLVERLRERSRLFMVIQGRRSLLRRQSRNDALVGVRQDDPPSVWPPELLAEVQLLTRRILARFRDEVQGQGREFAVLFVPEGLAGVNGRLEPEDSWYPFMERTCAELEITLIDPHAALRARHEAGIRTYDDHWSPAGHEVIADLLSDYLATALGDRGFAPPSVDAPRP